VADNYTRLTYII